MLWKMNAAELGRLTGTPAVDIDDVRGAAEALAGRNGRPVFVTLAERGIVGALPDRPAQHVPAFPVRGPLDIVGAGDSVSATLALASASGAGLREAMLLAMAAASIVIHQVGTTGAADRGRIAGLMFP
jgi:sugar/nucleoside kinase (ribokinase family)